MAELFFSHGSIRRARARGGFAVEATAETFPARLQRARRRIDSSSIQWLRVTMNRVM